MKWIDIKLEQPTIPDAQYICNCTHENGGELVIALVWDGDCWIDFHDQDIDWTKYITHWMPMPEQFRDN